MGHGSGGGAIGQGGDIGGDGLEAAGEGSSGVCFFLVEVVD